jgi:hypothetical protein
MKQHNIDDSNRVIANSKIAQKIKDKGVKVNIGDLVGVRLALNVSTKDTLVHTIHVAKTPKTIAGSVVDYRAFAVLTNCTFPVNQLAREKIASKTTSKTPMAQVNGNITNDQPSFDGVEVSFNPMRSHLFTDSYGYAVKSCGKATVSGHRVYCDDVVYYKESEIIRKGNNVTDVKFK